MSYAGRPNMFFRPLLTAIVSDISALEALSDVYSRTLMVMPGETSKDQTFIPHQDQIDRELLPLDCESSLMGSVCTDVLIEPVSGHPVQIPKNRRLCNVSSATQHPSPQHHGDSEAEYNAAGSLGGPDRDEDSWTP